MRPRPPVASVVLLGSLFAISARAQRLLDGGYVSTPSPSYTCAFGLVNWSVQTWDILVNGTVLTVSPVPAGSLPSDLSGTIDCQTGAFSASATIPGSPGGCTETYTLSGQVQSTSSWSGTFQAQYTGSGCASYGCVTRSFNVAGALTPTGIRSGTGTPSLASLNVGPNPSAGTATLRVQLEEQQFVRLVVHDVSGRLVATVVAGQWLGRGEHRYRWEQRDGVGERVPAGVYFVRLQAGVTEQIARLVVLH